MTASISSSAIIVFFFSEALQTRLTRPAKLNKASLANLLGWMTSFQMKDSNYIPSSARDRFTRKTTEKIKVCQASVLLNCFTVLPVLYLYENQFHSIWFSAQLKLFRNDYEPYLS